MSRRHFTLRYASGLHYSSLYGSCPERARPHRDRSQRGSRQRTKEYSFSPRNPLDEKCLDGIFLPATQTGSGAERGRRMRWLTAWSAYRSIPSVPGERPGGSAIRQVRSFVMYRKGGRVSPATQVVRATVRSLKSRRLNHGSPNPPSPEPSVQNCRVSPSWIWLRL
jgi:hypothetical protein